MSNLADSIELYIRRLLDASPNSTISLQRKELAEYFACVPSQINYVLSTRFTLERGYLVESRRGGGGYLRIRRLDLNRDKVLQLLEMRQGLVGQNLSLQKATDFIQRLVEARLVTRREGLLMKAVISLEQQKRDDLLEIVRGVMLARMIEVLLHET
ncbi:MAG: Transcriptional regulator CtsR [Dehalococcoidia bacterium]|nr:Transcriptional regulator CtsR [Bacillota bacterium]MBT9141810.1 Transcriptional regulator CtsR [Bacillota bacterium]